MARETLDAHSIRASARFDNLDRQTQEVLLYLLRNPADITSKLSQEFRNQMTAQTTTLSQILSRAESFNQDNHRQTRETILRCIKKEIKKTFKISRRNKDGQVLKDIITEEDTDKEEDTDTEEDMRGTADTVQCSCAQLRLRHKALPLGASEITAGIELLNVSKTAESKLRRDVYREIYESLKYPAMTHRYEEVHEAYPKTFEWAFHDPTKCQLPWSNLAHWLKQGDRIYWVNGKAGSGKSIFMKHLFDDKRTLNYLKTWAGNIRLCIATFFFWNSGTREQKSQPGLLRALLFQVLSQQPDLIPTILPEVWAKTYSKTVNEKYPGEDFTRFWSLQQLKLTFRALISQKDVPLKICFMVDGLDEFDGEHDSHEALANLFKEITESPNIKACISSRPLVVFEDLFGQCPNLRLQNLTYNDIRLYVMGNLSRNDAFQRLSTEEPEAAPAITEEIVEKADGVFLWVNLVVQSLLNGIRNRDELSDLWRRLRSMPRELEPLYNHLLELIDPFYLPWASKALQIVRINHDLGQDPFGKSSSARDGVDPLTVQTFYFAMNEDLDETPMQSCTWEWLDSRCEVISVWLTARCAGFLEVPREIFAGPFSNIRYFHRTVRDFLDKDTHWCKILMQTVNTDFNPNVSMMRSCLRSLQFANSNNEVYDPNLARDFTIYAYHADAHSKSHGVQSMLLDKMKETMIIWSSSWWNADYMPDFRGRPDFLKLATIYGLRGYVNAKLTEQGQLQHRATELLRCLLPNDISHAQRKIPLPRIDMASLLLDLGADPNGSCDSRSPWEITQAFLARESTNYVPSYDLRTFELTYVAIMEKLVLTGANPHTVLNVRDRDQISSLSAVRIVETFLLPKYPLEAASLLRALKYAMSKSNANGKRHRDEAEMDHTESRAKRVQVHYTGS